MPEPRRITVVGICGSLREGSATRKALALALSGAEEAGANAAMLDLREYDLPFAGLAHNPETHPDVARLSEQVRGAQGILLATPEYHGSYSGVLKNALDLMGFDEFEGKMIGLIGVAGGSFGASQALSHLRSVARQLRAWALPQDVSIPRSGEAFNEDGGLKDPRLHERVKGLGRDTARFARLHATAAEDFLKQWEKSVENPGGRQ